MEKQTVKPSSQEYKTLHNVAHFFVNNEKVDNYNTFVYHTVEAEKRKQKSIALIQ